MMRVHRLILAVLLAVPLVVATGADAKEPRTEHTFQLAEGESPPAVMLDDLAMLVGTWRGTAFGSTFEAVWLPPSAGSMVGLFKLMNDAAVSFYEILTITAAADGRLELRVKHFTEAFVAWESAEDFVRFKLVAVEPGALHFSGISFYARGPEAMDAYIVMKTGETVREEKLVYERVD